MIEFHAAFLVLVVGTAAFFSGLSVLNYRHGTRLLRERREWVAEQFGLEDLDAVEGYNWASLRLSLVRRGVVLAGALAALYLGLFGDAVAAIEASGLGPVAGGVVFFVGLTLVGRVVSIPFALYRTFVVEETYDFNEQSPRLWLRDFLVGTAVGVVIVAILGAAVMWIISIVAWWWLGVWVLVIAFGLVMNVVYPRVIAPLFYDFEHVEEGKLRDAVDDVFERAGFACEQVYEMDASSRSTHANAYFIGFGRTKRVVLFDTLVDTLELDEVKAVLAHELAHWKRNHIWKRMGASWLLTGLLLAVLWLLLDQPWLYEMFGVPADARYAGLVLAGLWVYPLSRLLDPLGNRLSIGHEYEADAFAAEVMGSEPMIEGLSRMTKEELSIPFPHPLYAAFNHTHPPIPERIRHLRSREEGGSDDGPTGVAGPPTA